VKSIRGHSHYVPSGIRACKLADLPDPDSRYAALPHDALETTSIVVPEIRDKNECIIHPRDYMTKLSHGDKVVVEVILKLYANHIHTINEILADPSSLRKKVEHSRSRQDEELPKSVEATTRGRKRNPIVSINLEKDARPTHGEYQQKYLRHHE
jgi:hypothetical protein